MSRNSAAPRCSRAPRLGRCATLTVITATITAAAAIAQIDPSTNPPEVRAPGFAKVAQHESLIIGNQMVATSGMRGVDAAEVSPRVEALGGAEISARVDRRGGRFGTVVLSHPLVPGSANNLSWSDLGVDRPIGSKATREAAWQALRAYVESNAAALQVEVSEFAAPHVTLHGGGDLIQITVNRQIGDIPVQGAQLTASIRKGNLALFGFHKWG